ncbi:MAG: TetR/AcrR family transcriptional regulator [Porticoccaceae bacterium]
MSTATTDTRTKILDVAEKIFAEQGLEGSSIREITSAADVRLAAVNYHFESKENLYLEVIKRRSRELIEDRHEALDAVMSSGLEGEGRLRAIVEAFVDPVFRYWYQRDEGWRNYCRLTARASLVGIWRPTTTIEFFNTTTQRFIEAIRSTFPDTDDYTAHMCMMFMLSNLLFVMTNNKRLDSLSGGAYRSDDLIRMKPLITTYIVAGVMGLVAPAR